LSGVSGSSFDSTPGQPPDAAAFALDAVHHAARQTNSAAITQAEKDGQPTWAGSDDQMAPTSRSVNRKMMRKRGETCSSVAET